MPRLREHRPPAVASAPTVTAVCCIDCGLVVNTELFGRLGVTWEDAGRWRCAECIERGERDDRAPRDEHGRRICSLCSNPLARLNPGPGCYACTEAHPEFFAPEPEPKPEPEPRPERELTGEALRAFLAERASAASWELAELFRSRGPGAPSLDDARRLDAAGLVVHAAKQAGATLTDIASTVGRPRTVISEAARRGADLSPRMESACSTS